MQISQVITEPELVNRSNELEGALVSGSYTEYCDAKIARSSSELDRTLWQFLKVSEDVLASLYHLWNIFKHLFLLVDLKSRVVRGFSCQLLLALDWFGQFNS